MKSWIVAAAIALTLGFASNLKADEAKYGGQIKDIGAYEGELVVKGQDVQLYLIKDHKAVNPSANMTANVRLFINNKESSVELKPEGNKLAGKAAVSATGPVRAMATLTDSGKDVGKAQYSLSGK